MDYIELQKFACRVRILVNEKIGNGIEHCADHTNYTIKIIPYNSYNDFHIVVFVHLPSKLRDNKEKNRHLLEQITCKVNELDQNRDRKVIILGDFNLNPYEDAMTYLTGCNAVSSKDIAMKIGRKDRNEKDKCYFYYYNPMWNFLGDRDGINGTFYYDKTVVDGLVKCEVLAVDIDDSWKKFYREFGVTSDFAFYFIICSDYVKRYQYNICTVTYGIKVYPIAISFNAGIAEEVAEVFDLVDEDTIVVYDEELLLSVLERILSSREVHQVLGGLMSIAQKERELKNMPF